MASAKNKVIAGDYQGREIGGMLGLIYILERGKDNPSIDIDSKNVESYELITDEHRKSASSGVARGIVGGALLGPVGMLAGGLSAKSKGIYTVAIQWKDGKKSLIEINDKLYKNLVKSCF